MLLGVNIDHIAVLREARKINDPDPLEAIHIVKRAGADQITIHLREDRRHIHDRDAELIIQNSQLPINLECSINPEIIDIVCKLKPMRATLVPENREEVTTEGGLDILNNFSKIKDVVKELQKNGIETSLFIDPYRECLELSHELNSGIVELHTGTYANIYAMLYSNLAYTHNSIKKLEMSRNELKFKLEKSIETIKFSSEFGNKIGLKVAVGHGLNYQNIVEIMKISGLFEANIGQSIIARSVFVGLEIAIKEMKNLL